MMKKRLSLEDLVVKSFTTVEAAEAKRRLRGGQIDMIGDDTSCLEPNCCPPPS
jgi:hypothetical protein